MTAVGAGPDRVRRRAVAGACVLIYLVLAYVAWRAAVLLATVLWPAVSWLTRVGCPRLLSTVLVFAGALAVLGGVLTLIVNALIDGADGLGSALRDGVAKIRDWLVHVVLLSVRRPADLATPAAVAPPRFRKRADTAGRHALSGYTRATVAVAVVDAVAIGVGLALIGVPMVIPLASLVFLGAFVPYVGAFIAGFVAVLVALVSGGPVEALLVLVLAVAVGVLVAGIAGALLAVPVVLTVRALYGSAGDQLSGGST